MEAAFKLARKVTGRTEVIAFTGAFHGMMLGALVVTHSSVHRNGAGLPLTHAICVPFGCRLNGSERDSSGIERLVRDRNTGLDRLFAVIVETVQGEGGINVAPLGWLAELAELCQRQGIVFIVDDVQMAFQHGELARKVFSGAFERGLLVETAGPEDEVVKLLPPLTATETEIDEGLALLTEAVQAVC